MRGTWKFYNIKVATFEIGQFKLGKWLRIGKKKREKVENKMFHDNQPGLSWPV